MQRIGLAILAAAGVLFCGAASAGTKLTVHVRTYDVAGRTGAELVESMDGLGPRHGHATRAIAETGYIVHWDLDVARDNGICRLRRANGRIDLTYTFPRRTSASGPALRKRWDRFMAGVRQHEHTHGRIAKQMMRATDTALAGLERPDNCSAPAFAGTPGVASTRSMPTTRPGRTPSTRASIAMEAMSSSWSMR